MEDKALSAVRNHIIVVWRGKSRVVDVVVVVAEVECERWTSAFPMGYNYWPHVTLTTFSTTSRQFIWDISIASTM